MKIKVILLALALLMAPSLGYSSDFKQKVFDKIVAGTERVGDELHTTLALAKKLGFFVDEIRFEVSLTPKIEVFFRDAGDTGLLPSLLKEGNKIQQNVLRLLQSTRKFKVTHYSPTGVKLITGVAKPSVEIIATWDE